MGFLKFALLIVAAAFLIIGGLIRKKRKDNYHSLEPDVQKKKSLQYDSAAIACYCLSIACMYISLKIQM